MTSGSARAEPQRILAIGCVLAAMSLVVLDAGMANVALPAMAQALRATPADIIWVITAYQTAVVMALLPCASLGERFGNRRVFQCGLGLFAAAAGLCALAPSLDWLVCARLLQGAGAAAVMALGMALLRASIAPRLFGAVVGWNALVVGLSSAAGPALGALVTTYLDWPWLFALSLFLAGVVLAASLALPGGGRTAEALDAVSMLLHAATFALLVLGLETLARSPWLAVLLLGGSAISITIQVRREASRPAPLIPFDLLRDHGIRVSLTASVLCFAATAAAMVALPFHLRAAFQMSPLATGLCLAAWPLGVAASAPFSSRLSDRTPTALLCAAGAFALAGGLVSIAVWPTAGGPHGLMALAAVCGAGFGFFQTPNNRNIFLSAPAERGGAAGGAQGTARLMGQTAGAVMMSLAFTLLPVGAAPRIGFGVAAVLALGAAMVSLQRRPRKARALASP